MGWAVTLISLFCPRCMGNQFESDHAYKCRPTDPPEAEMSEQAEPHPDDVAVDRFAAMMKRKLAKKRVEGRYGWKECAPIDLAQMLVEHLEKGDPVDIANFAMFLGSIDVYKGSVRAAIRMALREWVKENATCEVRFI